MRPLVLASLFVAAAIGCSASDNLFQQSTGFGNSGTGNSSTGGKGTGNSGAGGKGGSGTGASGMGGGVSFDAGPTDDGGDGCSAASQLVYVFDTDNTIHSFDPPSKVFTPIATPDCPASSPNSMAIDRNLTAWLNYLSPPGIYAFDLNKKTGCKLAINLADPGKAPAGFTQVGMGFATDMVGGTAETLYLSSISALGLAKVDMGTMTVTKIGGGVYMGRGSELTGTGDARLFGYFTTTPVIVAQIDKSTGAVSSPNPVAGFPTPFDWAFTFWGGDFYLYAAPGTNNTGNSSVVHYTPGTMTVDPTYVADVGFQIVGAGVSTCAPLKPPT